MTAIFRLRKFHIFTTNFLLCGDSNCRASRMLTWSFVRNCMQKSEILTPSIDSEEDVPPFKPMVPNQSDSETFGTLKHSLEKTSFHRKLKTKTSIQSKFSKKANKSHSKKFRPLQSNEPDVFGNLTDAEPMWYPDINEDEMKKDNDINDDSIMVRNLSKRYKCPKTYLNEMKQLVEKKKLKEALDLFVDMRRNFVIPLHQHYTFMIGTCGRAGFTEMAFKLLRQMTDRGYQPTPATLTGLFNSCAESPFPEFGLRKALMLKEKIETKNWQLTQITYHSMIKAFGKCGDIKTAFQIVDQMAKVGIKIDVATYSFLLMSCIANKEVGFTYAIEVWRKMKGRRCKPNLFTCNLLLRAARDCDIGPEEVSCLLLQHWSSFSNRPYGFLMKHNLSQKGILKLPSTFENESVENTLKDECPEINSASISDSAIYKEESKSLEENSLKEDTAIIEMKNNATNLLQTRPVNGPEILEILNINTSADRLALLGGMENFLKFMQNEKIEPSIKTFTLLLENLPHDTESEEKLLSLLDAYKLEPDISFFNVLIKKRNFRKDGNAARKVLLLMNKYGLEPDILTYGVLALGCRTHFQATNFINDMKKLGCCPNIEIIGALLGNACQILDFQYLKFILKLMENNEIKPDERLLRKLEETLKMTRENIINMEHGKEVNKKYKQDNLSSKYKQFCSFYEEWLKRMEFETEEHVWSQYRTNIVEKAQ